MMKRSWGIALVPLATSGLLFLTGCAGDATDHPASDGASPVGPEDATTATGSPGQTDRQGQRSGKASSTQQVKDQGRGAPGRPTKDGRQRDVFNRLPGTAAGGCLAVGTRRDVRSGGIVGGAFDEARSQFGTGEPGRPKGKVRLYWIPMHTDPMPGVTIKATHQASGQTTTERQTRVADTDQWKFYDTMITVDEPGLWRFVVTSGTDRGCFEVEFR